MNILLNMPTAAKVMQEATVHKVRLFLSLGSTQSMLYSFSTAIVVGYGVMTGRYDKCIVDVLFIFLLY